METASRKYEVQSLSEDMLDWYINVACVNMLSDELGRPDLVNLEQIRKLVNKGFEDKTAFVVKVDGVPAGAIGGVLTRNVYNPEFVTLAEMFWYVSPQYRGGRTAVLLLKAFEQRAEEVADEMTLSILPHSDLNISSLEKRGFRFEELAFRKEF